MEKMDILSLSHTALCDKITAMGQATYRANQIFSWLHQKRVMSFEAMTTLSRTLRAQLDDTYDIYYLTITKKLVSARDNTVKYLYKLPDGHYVETVLMEYHHGHSLCISTQVGCRMGCTFCASTIAGYVRNLTPSEMLLQIYETCRDSGVHVDSVVLMGIGEPLDNYDNVLQFLRLLSDPDGYGLSLRHVTISTCGIVPKINQLAQLHLGITLSVSLHSPDDARRSEMMPINRRYSIDDVLASCDNYFKETSRRITFEYAVIEGVNDARSDAHALSTRLRGMGCHVNLIPVNNVAERDFHATRRGAERFCGWLCEEGVNATVRRTLGSDIEAACGQLRRDAEKRRLGEREKVPLS